MGLRFYCTRRRSTTTCFTCLINSSIPTITGQRSIPAEPTPDNLSLEFNPGKPVLKVGSSGLPDVCSTMIAPVSKNFGVINDYGYSRCFGVEKKAKRGPHSNLILSRNYTSKSEEAEKQKLNMQMTVGNVLDFPGILFNKNRDYLVKYNGQRVYADQLAGKVVVLFFVPLIPICLYTKRCMASLVDTYNYLLPNDSFEVVYIPVDSTSKEVWFGRRKKKVKPLKHFEDLFSCMPWAAIPYSDITARKHLQQRFGASGSIRNAIIIGSNGKVLQNYSCRLFETYGGEAYPFTNSKKLFLKSQDDAIAKKPSLGALLASPERDYVISNKGDKVPIHTLEEKVVALYFYEEGYADRFTDILVLAYEELAKNKVNFEVVLIYLYDTDQTCNCTDEGSFWKKFKTMPWLALPYRDLSYRKLMRLFCYPPYYDPLYEATRLVIVGPRGEFIEPWGAHMLEVHNTFPFTREKVAQLETDKVKELKLEMLWGPNTFFRGKNETKVRLSQLDGKRIILFFESNMYDKNVVEFLKMLKEMYLNMKGTNDEFEVIYISHSENESCYAEHVEDVSWLVSLATELSPADYRLYCCFCQCTRLAADIGSCLPGRCHGYSSLLAFDRDGRLVRKSVYPTIEHMDFPFYAGSMEKEDFFGYNKFFGFWRSGFQGLVRNSYYKHDQVPPVIAW